ncbi:hypothetical protein [Dechloromonas sp. A34]|uniref:hypothetical protein n=1 Tax=Dechloromonas sp. A34 TaxID=447588 RepID=UPI0022492FA1|nr:hypothetical protein [Dechloromonas sp. A34]
MSQQINLLLPELRPRFDWLGLPVVASAALAGLLLVAALGSYAVWQANRLQARDGELGSRLLALQGQVQAQAKALAGRQGDPALPGEIAATRLAVSQRREVMAVIEQGATGDAPGYTALLQGFSRQVAAGVWLVGFSFAGKDVEIRGRLTDPGLLPPYISRLNDEPAFAGRRFARLDMKGVDPAADVRDGAPATAKPQVPGRYTEFALRSEQLPAGEGRP